MGSSEGGVLTGKNPIVFNESSPLTLFIVQLLLIIATCKIIRLLIKPLKQPSVISEVIGGIFLGPTIMGRMPGYIDLIFNKKSLPFLNLFSNFGLVLFLFLVGLELDPKLLKKGLKRSLIISIAGMALPFIIGVAVSYLLYSNFENEENKPNFITYLLFLGVAMSITAFPVLARILTEFDLLKTPVGIITISAAAIDDVTSWCLLACVISLINAKSALTALYVFLLGAGYVLICFFIIKPIFKKLLKIEGSYNTNKPSQFIIFVVFCFVFISSFITDSIGIHPIFGAFIAGISIPHDYHFKYHLTEKLEDIVSILFLPIYFAMSGLKTQIGLLNTAQDWGMVLLVTTVACLGKVTGCTLAALCSKMKFRKALAVGILMNCKGLVELIVLNLGYDAGVISQKTFTIMVIMALVTTFITSPLIVLIYPKNLQEQDLINIEENSITKINKDKNKNLQKVLICINKMEHVPAIMTIIQMLNNKQHSLYIYALRLIQLTERSSSMIMYKREDSLSSLDPIINVFRIFSSLTTSGIKTITKFCKPINFSTMISNLSTELAPDLTFVAWNGNGNIIDKTNSSLDQLIFEDGQNSKTIPKYSNYMKEVFSKTCISSNVGILVNKGGLGLNFSNNVFEIKIYVVFFGGKDDLVALELATTMALSGYKIIIYYYKLNFINENELKLKNLDNIELFKITEEEIYKNSIVEDFKLKFSKLDDKNLILLGKGRNFNPDILYKNEPNLTSKLDLERKAVLGDLAEFILLNNTNASMIVLKAKT